MHTNGGLLNCNQTCTVPQLGECCFNKDSITNIIALSDITDKFRVTMDTANEKAMLIHLPDRIVKFEQMSNGLYARDPTKTTSDKYQLVQTVEENLTFLTPRQQTRAKKAREIFHATGTPSVDDMKALIPVSYTHLTLPTICSV